MRINRPQMFMEIAHTVAKRSTCMRLNVGAVIVDGRSIISIGYNGSPAGEPHCSDDNCADQVKCDKTIHAEINALNHMPPRPDLPEEWKGRARLGPPLDMYVTDSPCALCFDHLMETHKFGRIFFGTPYRIDEHLINHMWDVEIYRVLPSGSIINWDTKQVVNVET